MCIICVLEADAREQGVRAAGSVLLSRVANGMDLPSAAQSIKDGARLDSSLTTEDCEELDSMVDQAVAMLAEQADRLRAMADNLMPVVPDTAKEAEK
jgi:hypothetical protein